MDLGTEHGNAQPNRSWILGALVMLWLACAAGGLFVVWAYENGPGTPAAVESVWPAHTSLERAADRPTLVLLAHPQCTCTRATLGEPAEALARSNSLPRTCVVFLKPSSMPDGWEQTDLWKTAAALPNAGTHASTSVFGCTLFASAKL